MITTSIKSLPSNRLGRGIAALTSLVALTILPGSAVGQAAASSTASTGTTVTNTVTQADLQLIINAGNGEITRRLTTLNNLSNGLNAAQFLSASDKSTLSGDVSGEISSLTSLKTKLDAETTVSAATTDALDVITQYRVYVLVVPQIYVVITADNQQATEAALTKLATNFQSAITAQQKTGKNVATLQSELSDLSSKVSAAQSISTAMEASAVGLQPSDYNSDHSVLVGDYDKLVTAQSDNADAMNDANQILSGLQAS